MREQLAKELSKLIGMPMESLGRAANMLWISFGTLRTVKDRLGEDREVGDYAVHVQCSWRITNQSHILVAQGDYYVPNSSWEGSDDDFDWDERGNNLFDERVQKLFGEKYEPVFVTRVEADQFGGFKIVFTSDLTMEVFPNRSNDREFWRMFIPFDESEHFVVYNAGIRLE